MPDIYMKNGILYGDEIQKHIFWYSDFFETAQINYVAAKYLQGMKAMIDVGANIGNHTIFFRKIGGFEHIYSFEPVKETFQMLEKNVRANNLSGVKLYNMGLGKQSARARIHATERNNRGATSLEYDEQGGLRIMALDEIYFEKKIDFIKIDVEGFERDVLLGAKKLLLKDRPVILVEIFEENRKSVFPILRELHYKKAEETDGTDFVFIPDDADCRDSINRS